MIRHTLVLAGALSAAALLIHCVGDAPVAPTPGTDAGDAAVTPDSATDASDGATDAGPKCVIADAGAPGSLDPAFANGLKGFPLVAGSFDAESGAVDSQGRIYVIGRKLNCVGVSSGFDVGVMRLAASGALDASFNNGKGYACFDTGGDESVMASFIDASDRLVFAGFVSGNSPKAMVGRMLVTGGLDPSFAAGAILAFTPETPVQGASYSANGATADGADILLSGSDQNPFAGSTKGWVLRVSSAGVVDTTSFTPYVSTAVKGFRGGHVKLNGQIFLPAVRTGVGSEWTLVTLDANGAFVSGSGAVTPPTATTGTVNQGIIVSSEQGKEDQLLVAGALGTNPSAGAATWWTKQGAPTGPVPTFAGFYWDPAYNRGPLVRQCDSKAVIGAATTATPRRPIITRLVGRDGTPDITWGSAGVAQLNSLDAGTANLLGVALVERPDGRLIVIAGTDELQGAWLYQLLP